MWIMYLFALVVLHAIFSIQGIPDKEYSYICLSAEQLLCFGISTDVEPSYNPDALFRLQLKVRDRNEEKGLDWMKTRWSVYSSGDITSRIMLANFTSLCLARESNDWSTPGGVVLRPCGTAGNLEQWDLRATETNLIEQGTFKLKTRQDQCLTVMNCNRGTTPSTDYCDPNSAKAYTQKKFDVDTVRGSYVKFMQCTNSSNQLFRQTLDCAPGCSPYMMQGTHNKCDLECANDACRWDNGTCATPRPTPPTFRPSFSPSLGPTTSLPSLTPSRRPSRSPSRTPSLAPSMSRPSVSPTTSHPSASPTTSRPSRIPSTNPTTSNPSRRPTTSPTFNPSAIPTGSPLTTTPSRTPSFAPSTYPSRSPSLSTPTRSPTPNVTVSSLIKQGSSNSLLPLWIVIGILLFLMLLCCCFFVARNRKNDEKSGKEQPEDDLESPLRPVRRGSLTPPSDGGVKHAPFDVSDPRFVLADAGSLPPKPQNSISTPVSPSEGVPFVPAVLPSQRKNEEDDLPLQDRESASIMHPDMPEPATPRTAAAMASLNPNPDKKPPGGAPGLMWGGTQDDLSSSEKQNRSLLRAQSQRLQEGDLNDALLQRSFKKPKENVIEGTGTRPNDA